MRMRTLENLQLAKKTNVNKFGTSTKSMVNQKTPIPSGQRLAIFRADLTPARSQIQDRAKGVDDRFSDTLDGDRAPPCRDKAHEKEVDEKGRVEPANRVPDFMNEVESIPRRAMPVEEEGRGKPEAAIRTPVGD